MRRWILRYVVEVASQSCTEYVASRLKHPESTSNNSVGGFQKDMKYRRLVINTA